MITSADYDRRVLAASPEELAGIYYRPKAGYDKLRIELVLGALQPAPGQRILDLGCGVGTFAFCCAGRRCSAVGCDYSVESVIMAGRLCREHGREVPFVAADCSRLPFSDACFDKVVAADFIEHINWQQKKEMLAEVSRVLKDGGLAVIFTPNLIREKLGELYWKIRRLFTGCPVPGTDLHFGLTDRRSFERLLDSAGFEYVLNYYDVTRPALARIPLLRSILALNLLWTVRKSGPGKKR